MLAAAIAICAGLPVNAFTLDKYASHSALGDGRWVQIAVTETGMHCVTEATLRSWGFNDPSKVKIYGYGARLLPDQLAASTYLDDLPQAYSLWIAGKGLLFYGEGPVTRQVTTGQYRRPAQNYFTTEGYYYLSDSDTETPRLEPQVSATQPTVTAPVDAGYAFVYHEVEQTSPGEAGMQLVGEDFKYTREQQFTFSLTEPVADETAYIETCFLAKTATGGSTLTISVNGKALTGDNISSVSDGHTHAAQLLARKTFTTTADKQLRVSLSLRSASTLLLANLDYIGISYKRRLTMAGVSQLAFEVPSATRGVTLAGASASTLVWDVTAPATIQLVDHAIADGGTAQWSARNTDRREYVAFNTNGTFPAPAYKGTVSNQDIHGMTDTPDMIIIAPRQWSDQAERLAEYRRGCADSLDVLVLTPQEVYNEFSSGVAHVQGLRKCLKMFYDRGEAAGKPLRYALMMGRAFYDNRLLTTTGKSLGYPILPTWFTEKGLSDNDCYTTDDFFGFLADGAGSNTASDKLAIAVGRLPVTSRAAASAAVDKIIAYETDSPAGTWKNNILTLADDQDAAVHMTQADAMWTAQTGSLWGGDMFYRKIYTDQYELVSNVYAQARTDFYRALDEGVMWWTYIGHASPTSLTAESVVTYTDLNNLFLKHWPVVYAATCDFMRWDSGSVSGAEILFANTDGGVIGAISATRPVYITNNGPLSEAFGRNMLTRDETGRLQTLGEIYRSAKNDYQVWYQPDKNKPAVLVPSSDSNKLRYVLLGDPAMRLATPGLRLVLDQINGKPVTDPDDDNADPTIIMARQQVTMTGHLEHPDGTPVTDFTGTVSSVLYDATRSITTRGNGETGTPFTFDQHGERLHMGNDSIRDGVFTINIPMPSEVSDNFRTATINLYARSTDGREGAGADRRFYIYGTDPDAIPDDEAPEIETFYLNHPTFRDGATVNPSPMLIARVSDNRAINLSTSGIGHQMTLILDGGRTYTDVANYYTPFADGTPGGDIAYPFEGLTEGSHTLRLRVWDTATNRAEAEISFNVESGLAPTIHDVYTDTNPARDHANFYVSHDRPDQSVTVTIDVYDMMGRPVWSQTRKGRSDMFESAPITWDLTSTGGHRVPRGIYLYRATITDEDSGEKTATASRRLAVTN